jgi:uncharacterized protein (DUF1778 family)
MAQSRAHIQATTRYEHKAYDKITVRVRKDGDLTREDIAKSAQAHGESMNEFILNAIRARIEKQ